MKKTITLILGIGLIIALVWFTINLMNNSGKSVTELIEFSVENTDEITKVIITDEWENKLEIVKGENGEWEDAEGHCLQQQNMDFILEAFQKIEFKGYVPDNSKDNYIGMMSAQHIKVEIFTNGEWLKTWYIGPSTKDHYGQVMLLDSKEYGKSDYPVIMKIKALNGIIAPRFKADYREWMCRDIFSLTLDEIKSVDLDYKDEPSRSFTVKRDGATFNVYQQGKLLPEVDTSNVFRYLNNYKDINFNRPNYELTATQVDSVKRTTPFCIMTVEEMNGNSSKLRLFRIKSTELDTTQEKPIEAVNTNNDLFWCELPSGALVKCQYFHFDKILLGHVYFPSMDLSGLKTHNGRVPKN